MRRKRCWKNCVCEVFYCRPRLNRKLLCMRCSFDEVCRILNTGICGGKDGKR